MSVIGGSIGPGFDEQALMRGVRSVRHPLTRALLALTFTTGLVDAVSYLALGRVFTANMTGNIVLLGFGFASSGGLPVVAPVISLAAFLLGSAGGGRIVTRAAERHPVLVVRALAIEVSVAPARARFAGWPCWRCCSAPLPARCSSRPSCTCRSWSPRRSR